MLARSGSLPAGCGWSYELKWDGFRAIIRAGRDFRVQSRRGWNMTARVPELAGLPVHAVLDGELIALGDDGWPDFPLLCERVLNSQATIPLRFIVFDVLELDGESTLRLPHRERRKLLDSLALDGSHWQTSPLFDDGDAVWQVAQERGLEGVVAKRDSGVYRPGERGSWVKVKNREYWRYGLMREGARYGSFGLNRFR
jgi:bifunctional non-homologous end joining protein LigD